VSKDLHDRHLPRKEIARLANAEAVVFELR
jgi:hypothetical protein